MVGIALIINTPLGNVSHFDEQAIRQAALQYNVPCITRMTGAQAIVEAIAASQGSRTLNIRSLQELHASDSQQPLTLLRDNTYISVTNRFTHSQFVLC